MPSGRGGLMGELNHQDGRMIGIPKLVLLLSVREATLVDMLIIILNDSGQEAIVTRY